MGMKITLISPYMQIQVFGLRTISACLKQEGHHVQTLFLPKPFKEQYREKALNEIVGISKDSDLIGISLMTNYFDNVVQITQKLKENCHVPILWGSIHTTVRPEECLNYADMVCIGEGERAIVELANKMEAGEDYYNTRSIWFAVKGEIIKNPLQPLLQNLDDIPFPDYDYRTFFVLDEEDRLRKIARITLYPIIYTTIPTRGCPFSCTYCCNNAFNKMYSGQKIFRKRSIDNIINELLIAKTLASVIRFDDDAFLNLSLREIKDFCKKYKEKIELPLVVTGATPSTISKEKLSLLVDTGLSAFRMGIQTGSNSIKKLYNIRHTNQQLERAARIIKDHNIKHVQYDIILDNPWETEEDVIKTLMFLSRLPVPYCLSLFSLIFYPGTALYEKAKREGIITDDLVDVYRKHLHGCKNTYLNGLFLLLSACASRGIKIPTFIMFLLTNKISRRLKFNTIIIRFLSSSKIMKIKQKNDFSFNIQRGIL